MAAVNEKVRKRFPRLSSSAFEHPLDTQALDTLRKIPVLDKVMKKFLELGVERMFRIMLMGQAIHVTTKQCHKIHKVFKEACDILDMHEPDLFLMSDFRVNAWTFGVERPFIVLNSALVDLLDEDELMAVLAHELGHVKAGHVLYRSLAYFLLELLGKYTGMLGPLVSMALTTSLADWARKSELTADRAELLVVQDVDTCIRLHMKLAGGSKTVFEQTDIKEFLKQGGAYEDFDYSTLNKFYKLMYEMKLSHPLPIYRAKEVKTWSESGQYKEILAGRYPTDDRDVQQGLRSCQHCSAKISPSFFFCPDCGKSARV
ncbi:MAG: M48 family metallopeptidase [Candidatus Obscuribacterales bacterium]|nr:M48 family metallopeptidase [Candidatus Obscuribacterales bacterium]